MTLLAAGRFQQVPAFRPFQFPLPFHLLATRSVRPSSSFASDMAKTRPSSWNGSCCAVLACRPIVSQISFNRYWCCCFNDDGRTCIVLVGVSANLALVLVSQFESKYCFERCLERVNCRYPRLWRKAGYVRQCSQPQGHYRRGFRARHSRLIGDIVYGLSIPKA